MYEVPVGTAIVSYIEPHPGQARAFNRWYERDHFYAAVAAGPGVFAGARFVAPRSCKAERPAGGWLFGDVSRGSFLSLAWLTPGYACRAMLNGAARTALHGEPRATERKRRLATFVSHGRGLV